MLLLQDTTIQEVIYFLLFAFKRAAMSAQVVDGNDASSELAFNNLITLVTQNANSRVSVDCEGVNLGRNGSLEILTVCFEAQPHAVFLVDFNGANRNSPRIAAAKKLLESENVVKIIHDCRKDCDALYQLFGIQMKNIHDTSYFHQVAHGDKASLKVFMALQLMSLVTRMCTS